ncbi:hypothetical protein QR680_016151 [Steinernema hermaphroditum]|uniref:G-protein coupled receptors family 1 profile domain-containing protein n=1 Tax=Steinernema hermaphroditum TaxID=289476 RepID=A0AA39HA81_9BILA|nr:hypothetical protein QR680_016151 [Steinernema hermaphroditum]
MRFIWIRALACISSALVASLCALIGLDGSAPTSIRSCYITLGWSALYREYYSCMTTFFSATILVAYAFTFLSYWATMKKMSLPTVYRERRIARTLVLVVLAYLICWCLPKFITTVHRWTGSHCDISVITSSIGYLDAMNSVVNVAIYGCTHRPIRNGMASILRIESVKFAKNKIFSLYGLPNQDRRE